MFCGDSVHDAETHARAANVLFGGIEGLKDSESIRVVDARPVIPNLNRDEISLWVVLRTDLPSCESVVIRAWGRATAAGTGALGRDLANHPQMRPDMDVLCDY